MNYLSVPFFVILYFIVTNIKCAEKTFLDRDSNKLDSILTFFNNSNFSKHAAEVLENYPSRNMIDVMDVELSNEERGKRCLRNVSKCIEEDGTYRQTSKKLIKVLSSSLPPFDLSRVPGVSLACQKDSRNYIMDLKKFKLWALKMYDSSAKLPSGILNGNINQLGDFDMCLGATSDTGHIKGQYCLASIEVQVPNSPYLAGIHKLMQAHYHFKSELEDPGHRVPKFSSINWALCVPSSCTTNDVKKGLKNTMKNILEGTELEVRYKVNPEMCQKADGNTEVPFSTKVALAIFIAIFSFEALATFYDAYAVGDKSNWITSFSLTKNVEDLVTIKRSQDDIQTIHGIRMMNAILLMLAHKSMALFFLPYVNRTSFVEYFSRPSSVVGRAASLYTDPFIMISGLLTSYSLIGKLNKTGKIDIKQEYVSRLYRIIPTFATLIAFCTFIMPWITNGPMWPLVVMHHSDICKKYWWRNMLFIHNYFGFKDMCLTHTHHLGIDTELFFVSPFLIYALWKWPLKGSALLVFFALASTVARYYVTYTMRLSNYVHFGTSVQQLFDTADYMYILPPHRATVYIMGIFMGYALKKYGNITLSKAQIRIGNTLALFSFMTSYFGPAFMGDINYVYNPTDAAWYAAISPILWVASFCWVIFSAQLGHKGIVVKFFSLPVWTLWTKVSYTVYLTQFPIFFYNVGVTRASQEFGFFTKLFNLQEYTWVLGLSVVLTLTIEMPFQNIRTLMLKRTVNSDNEKCAVKKTL